MVGNLVVPIGFNELPGGGIQAASERLDDVLWRAGSAVADGLNADALKNLIEGVDGDGLAVGKAQFQAVSRIALGLCGELDKVSADTKTKVKTATDQINAQLNVWINEQQKTRDQIENIRRELEKQKIKLDMGFIRKVTADASNHAAKLAELKKSVPKQQTAYKARGILIQERRELKAKIFATRQGFATKMNENLAECVVDYTVTLKSREGVLSPELEELVKGAMGWRTSQVPKAALIAQHLSPLVLYDVLDKNNPAPLLAITDGNGSKVFSSKEAADIISKLREWDNWVAIQRCLFEDRPEIRVTKMVELPNGKRAASIKDFSKLSLGQQQSILLTILLFSQSTAPLIIDQPEDNLDSEFVYTTLVRSLRSIKERRQVIVVTHNANIAVLGDAELIIPLRAASDVSVIRDRGSIDTPKTKNIVCTILEGSARAFLRRHELYGY